MKLVAAFVALLAIGCVGGINLEADPVDTGDGGSTEYDATASDADDPLARCTINCIASCDRIGLPFGVCYPSDDRYICRCYTREPSP